MDRPKNFDMHRGGVVATPRADGAPGAEQMNLFDNTTGTEEATAYTFLGPRPVGRHFSGSPRGLVGACAACVAVRPAQKSGERGILGLNEARLELHT